MKLKHSEDFSRTRAFFRRRSAQFYFALVACLLIADFPLLGEARIFDLNKERFAAYLGGTYYTAQVKNSLLSDSSGSNLTLDPNFSNSTSGGFGFIYGKGHLAFRFGFEVIRPAVIKNRDATNAAGTALYNVNSEVAAYAPKLGIEFSFASTASSRAFIYAGYGSASLTGRNSYEFTSAGTTAYGLADFYEDLRSTAALMEGSLGYEFLMADTTTIVLEAGYRSLDFISVKHNRDVTGFQGAVVKGDGAKNMDGSDRKMSLTGPFAGLLFRFWLY